MSKLIAYLGLDGSGTASDWGHAVAENVPPLAAAAAAAWAVGADGWSGFAFWVAFSLAGWAIWLPLVFRFAPWRREPPAP